MRDHHNLFFMTLNADSEFNFLWGCHLSFYVTGLIPAAKSLNNKGNKCWHLQHKIKTRQTTWTKQQSLTKWDFIQVYTHANSEPPTEWSTEHVDWSRAWNTHTVNWNATEREIALKCFLFSFLYIFHPRIKGWEHNPQPLVWGLWKWHFWDTI